MGNDPRPGSLLAQAEKLGRVFEELDDGAWAPGDYRCLCVSCTEYFTGDKRAHNCLPCAVEALHEYIEDLEQQVSYLKSENMRSW
jgi:hypothetical protein